MDMVSSDSLHISIALLCVSLSVFLFLLSKGKSSNIKLPPGKTGWPIIGEAWEFLMACKGGDPAKFIIHRMNKYSPEVFQTSLIGEKLAMFCGPTGNKFLFLGDDKYVTTYWPRSIKELTHEPGTVVASWKEEIGKINRFLPEFLKPEALQGYVSIMDSATKEHLEADWIPHEQVKAFPLSKKYTFSLSCKLFMGIKDPELEATLLRHLNIVADAFLSLPINFPGTTYNRGFNAGKMLRRELQKIIDQRKRELFLEKKEPQVIDLLTRMLLSSKDENGETVITDNDITSKITLLLLASHDTTAGTLTSVTYHLAEYPDVYNKVLKEQRDVAMLKAPGELLNRDDVQKMKYSWCVVREVLRTNPTGAVGGFRETITDVSFAGFTIPKGWKGVWLPHSTHKNPKYFPDPEKFDPSRFEGKAPEPYTFVPFGGGPRMCQGKDYARFAILIFVHNLVTRFKLEKVVPDEKLIYHSFVKPTHGLRLRLHRHEI